MKKPSNSNYKPSQEDLWTENAILAQSGDKVAYNELLRDIAPFIRNYIFKSLANPEWADDITQEVLLSVHRSLNTYSPDRPFRPWLMAIINFRRTDFLRKHYNAREHKQTTLESTDFLKSHVTEPNHAGEYKDIEKALETLPEQQRKVFEMIKIQGYSAKEVANEMKMSVSAVKVSAHRT
ncbi:MAG: sigma-70 family RNA polymerase sigma factor, partial [Alphaproteobacteria bacterium]|nr:sigma-70 family RNA polymerase sigma factor [Alphaproteobacteria bacterium]